VQTFLLVGAGGIANAYEAALDQSSIAKLAAVVDLDEDRARQLATNQGAPHYTQLEEALAGTTCDAAIVCTPPSTHKDLTISLLNNGLHVLCEKPLAIKSEDAQSMVSTAKQKDLLLTMGSKFRYVADVVKAKHIVDSGILGEIVLFENEFTGWVDMSNRWNSQPEISGGGVLIDNGTHSLDLVRYFLGSVAEVKVIEGKRLQTARVEDTVRIFTHSRDNIMGSVDLSWTINKESETLIDVYGSTGTIHVGWKGSRYRQADSNEWVHFGEGYNKIQAFRSQIENLCHSIEGRESLVITSDDALASVQAVEAAYQSLASGQWVDVEGTNKNPQIAQVS